MSERLKILIPALGLKVGTFARAMGVSDTNVRNYLDRGSKPSSEFLEKLIQTFDSINPVWLLTGKGEPLLSTSAGNSVVGTQAQNIYGNSIGLNLGTNTQMGPGLNDLDLPTCKARVAQLEIDIQNLREQLQRADALSAAKDETIALLRGAYRNPN